MGPSQMLCYRQGNKTKRTAAQAQFPLDLQSGCMHLLYFLFLTSFPPLVLSFFLFKEAICTFICWRGGDYCLANTPKSTVNRANITSEARSVTKHRHYEVQSAVTCELVE